jgi:hypothetical protein
LGAWNGITFSFCDDQSSGHTFLEVNVEGPDQYQDAPVLKQIVVGLLDERILWRHFAINLRKGILGMEYDYRLAPNAGGGAVA